jgi:hypothetical protein
MEAITKVKDRAGLKLSAVIIISALLFIYAVEVL